MTKNRTRPALDQDAREATVAEVMTQVVVTVEPETPISELVTLLDERSISGAPVVTKDGKVVGVVSRSDLLRAIQKGPDDEGGTYYDDLGKALRVVPALEHDGRTALDVATRRVVSIDETAPLSEAAKVLLELGIYRLLVTRNGRFAGLLTATDVLKWVARPALEKLGAAL